MSALCSTHRLPRVKAWHEVCSCIYLFSHLTGVYAVRWCVSSMLGELEDTYCSIDYYWKKQRVKVVLVLLYRIDRKREFLRDVASSFLWHRWSSPPVSSVSLGGHDRPTKTVKFVWLWQMCCESIVFTNAFSDLLIKTKIRTLFLQLFHCVRAFRNVHVQSWILLQKSCYPIVATSSVERSDDAVDVHSLRHRRSSFFTQTDSFLTLSVIIIRSRPSWWLPTVVNHRNSLVCERKVSYSA